MNAAVLENTRAERAAAVRAVVIDGMEFAIDVPQGKAAITNLHGAPMARGEAVDFGDGMKTWFAHEGSFSVPVVRRAGIFSSRACRGTWLVV